MSAIPNISPNISPVFPDMPRRFPIQEPSNGLGVAGFVVSLVGFFASCGLLSPVGLVMSLIALRKRPRGFATAGVIVGFIGSLWIFALFALGLVAAGVAAVGIGAASEAIHESDAVDRTRQAFSTVESSLRAFEHDQGRVAYDLELLRPRYLQDGPVLDGWDRPIRFELQADGGSILTSDGPDGAQGTDDDLRSIIPGPHTPPRTNSPMRPDTSRRTPTPKPESFSAPDIL